MLKVASGGSNKRVNIFCQLFVFFQINKALCSMYTRHVLSRLLADWPHGRTLTSEILNSGDEVQLIGILDLLQRIERKEVFETVIWINMIFKKMFLYSFKCMYLSSVLTKHLFTISIISGCYQCCKKWRPKINPTFIPCCCSLHGRSETVVRNKRD